MRFPANLGLTIPRNRTRRGGSASLATRLRDGAHTGWNGRALCGGVQRLPSNLNAKAPTTARFDRDGVLLWAAQSSLASGGNSSDLNAITLDGSGNVLVAGACYLENRQVYVTMKYTPTGMELWARRFTNSCGYVSNTVPYRVDTDEAGDVYVSGSVGVVKYSSNGGFLWSTCQRYNRALVRVLPAGLGFYLTSRSPDPIPALGLARLASRRGTVEHQHALRSWRHQRAPERGRHRRGPRQQPACRGDVGRSRCCTE